MYPIITLSPEGLPDYVVPPPPPMHDADKPMICDITDLQSQPLDDAVDEVESLVTEKK